MKKYFLLFSIFLVAFSSCKKSSSSEAAFDAEAQAKLDDATIKEYLFGNNITTAIKDPSGLYYTISNPGTGAHPTGTSGVTIAYTLNLMSDGSQIEKRNSINFTPLSSLIKGWQIGLPLIGTGGVITLYVPSGLGYGNTNSGSITANSILIFNITLQGFTP